MTAPAFRTALLPPRRAATAAAAMVAVLVPVVVRGDAARADAAAAFALLTAALGLAVLVGPAGAPSLAQGAFVGVGAYGTAVLQARHGWDPAVAGPAAVLLAMLAGAAVAAAVRALRPSFVAVATWLGAWTFTAGIAAFPATTGGARGLVPPDDVVRLTSLGLEVTLTPAVIYEVAVVVAAIALWTVVRVRGRARAALALARDDAPVALAAGVPVGRLRAGAFVVAAALGGAAGVVLLQARGVADPTAYGPLLSVQLLLVVLVGGADRVAGPVAGLAALGVAGFADDERLATALLLVGVVAVRGRLATRTGRVGRRRGTVAPATGVPPPVDHGAPDDDGVPAWDGASVCVRGVHVRFGGVDALAGVDLDVAAGSVHAIVGGNGSGKTTLLRVVAGVVEPDRGVVLLDARDVTPLGPDGRRAAGVARTLQRAPAVDGLRAVDVVMAAAEPGRRTGVARAVAATPAARREQREVERRVRRLLALVGAGDVAEVAVAELGAGTRRLVQIAAALAGGARVLLLDEPSAGGDPDTDERLRAAIARLRDGGLTVVLVEHHQRLVAGVADHVTLLEAGHVVVSGSPRDVLAPRAG